MAKIGEGVGGRGASTWMLTGNYTAPH